MRPVSVPELLNLAPSESTAVVLPEPGLRISYKGLREQVATMADSLAAMGIGRGDRVATVFPSGLPAIVTFLAASIAGTAAPLNPAYRRDEFKFYLEDTASRILLCPPDAAEEAREAAKDRVPVYEVHMDEKGFVRMLGAVGNARAAASPTGDDIALILHTKDDDDYSGKRWRNNCRHQRPSGARSGERGNSRVGLRAPFRLPYKECVRFVFQSSCSGSRLIQTHKNL
jgi:acyl-CoA synthetase (AMP-forming)/AMP-acid ligase II